MEYKHNQKIEGFIINGLEFIKEIQSTAYYIEHIKTGAKLIYINNKNEVENLFSIAIKTFPHDNTGLPHILEHCVLCGSKKYPNREIFSELLKSSMATFLNAMTYSDKTVYLFMSVNEYDFCNLLKVYCDAVFYPNLCIEDFKKESYYLSYNKDQKKIMANGIVYNEMKGVYSDIIGILDRKINKNIFINNIYGKDAGGDPNDILDITYKKLKSYHKKYYHPSNSYTLLYGDINLKNILKILNQTFSHFNNKKINFNIKTLKAQENIQSLTYPFKNQNKSIVASGFQTNKITDTIATLVMQIIEIYLLDKDSSPLKFEIIKENICDSLIYSGYFDMQLYTYFCICADGVEKNKEKKFLEILESFFKKIVKNKLDLNRVKTSIKKILFSNNEIKKYYQLNIMNKVYNYWIYSKNDPLKFIKINNNVEKLNNIIKKGNSDFFIKYIKQYITDNNNKTNLILLPDKQYNEKLNKKLDLKIQTISKKNNSKLEHKTIIKNKKKSNYKINIPIQKLKNQKNNYLNTETVIIDNVPLIKTDIFTNNISYIDISFNFNDFDLELIDILSIFSTILLKLGTKKHSFIEIDKIEDEISCFISLDFHICGSFYKNDRYKPQLIISAKSLQKDFKKLLDILSEKLLYCDFSDIKRIKNILLEEKANIENNIIYNGSQYALNYANRKININTYIYERLNGISKLKILTKILNDFNNNSTYLIEKMTTIKNLLFKKNKMIISVSPIDSINNNDIKKFIGKFNTNKTSEIQNNIINQYNDTINKIPNNIYLLSHSNVSFNTASLNLNLNMKDESSSIISSICNYLTYDYLWNEIRELNGAYGVGMDFSKLDGCINFYTYRDPKITESYKIFLKFKNYICNELNINTELKNKIIISFLKKVDYPIKPNLISKIALIRYISKIDNKKIQKYREIIFDINENKIKSIFNDINLELDKIYTCTLSNNENLKEAKELMKKNFNIDFKVENL